MQGSFDKIALVDHWEVVDLLDSLISKSLVFYEESAGEGRYHLIESVRQYSAERLHAAGEARRLRDAHKRCILDLVDHAAPRLMGAARAQELRRLSLEHDNIRAALMYGDDSNASEDLLRLASGLWWYWYFTGQIAEANHWLTTAVANAGASPEPGRLALAEFGLANAAMVSGDMPAAREHGRRSVAHYEDAGITEGLGLAVTLTGLVTFHAGDRREGRRLATEGVEIARASSSRWDLALSLVWRAYVLSDCNENLAARKLLKESAAIWRGIEDEWGLSLALSGQALISARMADYGGAIPVISEAIHMYRNAGDQWNMAESINLLGEIARRQLDFAEAGRRFREALRLYNELGDRGGTALVLSNLAQLARAECRDERAVRLFAAASPYARSIGIQGALTDRREFETYIGASRAALGAEAFQAAWDDGIAIPLDAAIEFALGDNDR